MTAEEELLQAVEKFLHAKGITEEGKWVLGDFVAFAELSSFDEDLKQSTKYSRILPQGLPTHRVLGLIDIGTALLEEQASDD